MSKKSFSAVKGNYVREKIKEGYSKQDARNSFDCHEHGFYTKSEYMIEKSGNHYEESISESKTEKDF